MGDVVLFSEEGPSSSNVARASESQMIDMNQVIAFAENRKYDPRAFLETLDDIIRVVIRRHFPYGDYEEFRSIGLERCIKLLRSDYVDLQSKSLLNFLYTGIRNEISNYIRSRQKRAWWEEEEIRTVPLTRETQLSATDPFYQNMCVETLWKNLDSLRKNLYNLGLSIDKECESFRENLDYEQGGRFFKTAVRVASWRTALL